jgi:leucine dehydrogenase
MGGAINDQTIEQLKVDIIAGAANNQLASPYHDKMLKSKNILYVPDYVINSGGVICVGYEYFRNSSYNPQDFNLQRGSMVAHVERIGKTVSTILERAQDQNLPTGETADKLAEEIFLKGAELNTDSNPEDSSSYDPAGGTRMVQ